MSRYLADIRQRRFPGRCSTLSFRKVDSIIYESLPSHMLEELENVECNIQMLRKLPYCEHSMTMPCSVDPASVACSAPCQGALQCCGKTCKSTCSACLSTTLPDGPDVEGQVLRTLHVSHPCERILKCQHLCGLSCHPGDESCNPKCKEECRQQCVHHWCPLPCSNPCAPCMEPCPWTCPHEACPVLCGSVRGSTNVQIREPVNP